MTTVQECLFRAKKLANNVSNVLNELAAAKGLSQELTTSVLQNTLTLAATQMNIISDDIQGFLESVPFSQPKEEK